MTYTIPKASKLFDFELDDILAVFQAFSSLFEVFENGLILPIKDRVALPRLLY
jgi:hypothetical protein